MSPKFTCAALMFVTLCAAPAFADCRDAKTEELPEIILVGEDHYVPESVWLREILLLDGIQGLAPVISELTGFGASTNFFPDMTASVIEHSPLRGQGQASKIFGLESKDEFALASGYLLMNIVKFDPPERRAKVLEFTMNYARRLAMTNAALVKVKEQATGPLRNLAAEVYTQVENSIGDDDGKRGLEMNSRYGMDLVYQLVAEVHAATVAIANQSLAPKLGGRTLYPAVDGFSAWANQFCFLCTSQYDFVVVELRNQAFARNVTDLICQNLGKEKFLFVLAGAHHMPGLRENLDSLFPTGLRFQSYKTFEKEDFDALEKFLGDNGLGEAISTYPRK